MAITLNFRNCETNRKNLGLPNCIVETGIPRGFIIVPKGWIIDLSSGTFDLDYVNGEIQAGNFVPVLGAVEFTNNTPEPTTEEYQGGIMSVVRNGLPQFAFKFIKGGWAFAQALYTWNSQQAFDILIVDSRNNILGATSGTTFSGFDLGMLNSGTYMFTDGNVSGSVTVTMQLVDADQFNSQGVILTREELGFSPLTQLIPITDIVLTARADASENKVYFKAKFAMNQAQTLGGIAITNLRSIVEGANDTITALSLTYDSLTDEYSYEPTATLTSGNTVVVQLYDSVANLPATKIGNNFYKGVSNTATTVA